MGTSRDSYSRFMNFPAWLCLALITACASSPPLDLAIEQLPSISYEDTGLFGDRPHILNPDNLLSLTQEQEDAFLDYFHHPDQQNIAAHLRVANYLESSTFDFKYKPITLIAEAALAQQRGNCMSLALLTTALARLSGVVFNYQLIDSTPVFESDENVIVKNVHVRTKLYNPVKQSPFQSIFQNGIVVDYFAGGVSRFLGNLDEAEFLARYYLNVAAEYIQGQDFKTAYWYALKSLEMAPQYADSINIMAVIYKGVGDESKSEEIYRYGIAVAEDKLALLKNYHILLSQQERTDEAEQIQRKINTYTDLSPFPWIGIADIALEAGEYEEAARYYNKSIELAPYLQFGYLGLARVYAMQGHLDMSRQMLVIAMEKNYHTENESMYLAKLGMIKKAQYIHGY